MGHDGPGRAGDVRGQGFIRSQLRPSFDAALRARSAACLWIGAIAFFATQQFGSAPEKVSLAWYVALTSIAALAAFIQPFLPRYASQRLHLTIDHICLVVAWILSALVIYSSGGAASPYHLVWLPTMVFGAFFMPTAKQMLSQVAIGVAAALAPFAYDTGTALDSGFAPAIFCALAVYLTATGLVWFRRGQMRAAELDARRMAMTDPLTGVANLRAFRRFGDGLVESRRNFAVVLIDLDGLRATNIVFGHTDGDDVICRTAGLLTQTSGLREQVARLGGDEFAVLLPDSGALEAESWTQRFDDLIAQHNENAHSPRENVAASSGFAVFGDDGTTLTELVSVADARLFERKTARQKAFRQLTERTGAIAPRPRRQPYVTQDKFEFGRPSRLPDVLVWLLGAAIIAVISTLPGYEDDGSGARLLAVIALAIAACIAVGGQYPRRIADLIAIVTPVPLLLLTGGPDSPAITAPLLVVAYYASFWPDRVAAPRIAAMLTLFGATYLASGDATAVDDTRFFNAVFYAVMIYLVLRHNARSIEAAEARARSLSLVDPLTGIGNRRVFERELIRLRDVTHDDTGPWPAIALLNIDGFRRVNEELGHQGGDDLLCEVARVLVETVDADGTVCRIDGDEFAVVGAASDIAEVGDLARRCRDAVTAVGENSPVAGMRGRDVSVSVGYAIGRPWVTIAMLVAEADVAIQAGKDNGRGEVIDGVSLAMQASAGAPVGLTTRA